MKTTRIRNLFAAALLSAMAAAVLMPAASQAQPGPYAPLPAAPPAPPAPPAPAERVAAVKKSFADSQAALHKYEWIETTVTSLKGEEKSRVQKRCYYGAEGTIQKVLITPTDDKAARGIIGRIKEKKKEELADYMEDAAALMQQYLPPDPAKIQACKEAGKVSILMLDPGKRAAIQFSDYNQPGDMLSIEIDLTSNRILGASVKSALGKDQDPVTLDLRFETFPDGTIYNSQSTLNAEAKKVTVVVQNSGYRQTSP